MDSANWLIFAFLAPISWSFVNVVDRALVVNLVKNEAALTFMSGVFRFLFSIGFWLVMGFEVPPLPIVGLALVAGILNQIGIMPYLRALDRSETSTAILLFAATHPVMVLILSYIFLSDILSILQWLAFAVLLGAGVLSSLDFNTKLKFRTGLLWILLAGLIWSFSDVIIDPIVESTGFLTILPWMMTGSFIGSLGFLLAPKFRAKCRLQDFKWAPSTWALYVLAMIPNYAGFFFFLGALEQGSVAMSAVILNIQPLLVFLFELVLSGLFIVFPKPDVRRMTLIPKGFALLLVIAGVWLLKG